MADFILRKITGMNDSDPPTEVGNDQAISAVNVEFHDSSLGERRLGCVDIDISSVITSDPDLEVVSFLHRGLQYTDESRSDLWALIQNFTTQNVALERKGDAGGNPALVQWNHVGFLHDNPDVTNGAGFQWDAQNLHGKVFFAFKSVDGVNRLHVYDGTFLRRVGLAPPETVPTAGNTGSGSLTGERFYRVRFTITESPGFTVVRLRSEPTEAISFTPSGSGSAVRITRPDTHDEIDEFNPLGEARWELEASLDNANFYRIVSLPLSTTTYDDSTSFATGYVNVDGAVLSDDIGDYSLIHSGKFLAADEDRLLIGSSWEDDELASRVSWTPVYNDPGVANDERIPTDTVNFLDLDGFEGGPLTHMSGPVNGSIWAFKYSQTYKLVRTGIRDRAYQAFNVSKHIGAISGSVVEGVDQSGMPCLYFLDPDSGPCRTGGSRVMQTCGRDIANTWSGINLDGIVVARAVFYHEKNQVHWWVATGDSDYPNLKIILQTNNTSENSEGISGGWTTATGTIAEAYSVCLYAENVDEVNAPRSLILRPFIGVTADNDYILRCDTGDDDNGDEYTARLLTKAYIVKGLLHKFRVKAGALLGVAHDTARLILTLVRDFGLEEPKLVETSFVPEGDQSDVVKRLAELTGSRFYAVQIEFSDTDHPTGQWKINRLDLRLEDEESA